MKKIIAFTLVVIMVSSMLVMFAACGGGDGTSPNAHNSPSAQNTTNSPLVGLWEVDTRYYLFLNDGTGFIGNFDDSSATSITWRVSHGRLFIYSSSAGWGNATVYQFNLSGNQLTLETSWNRRTFTRTSTFPNLQPWETTEPWDTAPWTPWEPEPWNDWPWWETSEPWGNDDPWWW